MEQINVLAKIALNAWQTQVDRTTRFINELSDEQLMLEIAPGRNLSLIHI